MRRGRRLSWAFVVLAGLAMVPGRSLQQSAAAQDAKRERAPVSDGAEPLSKKDLLKAWETGANKLKSYDVYLAAERKTYLDPSQDWKPLAAPSTSHESLRHVFSSGRLRFEPGVERPGQKAGGEVVIWDGKRALVDHRALGGDGPEAVHAVNTLREAIPGALDYEGLYRTVDTVSLIGILRKRPWTRLETKEGDQYVLFTPTTFGKSYEYSPFGFRVWLNSRCDFLPTKIQFLYPAGDEDLLYGELEMTLKEVAAGIWAPVKAIRRHYPSKVQAVSPPVMSAEATITVDVKSSRFNVEIPDSMFQVAGISAVEPQGGDQKPADGAMLVTVLGPDKTPLAGARIHASIWTSEPFQANQDYVCNAEGKATVRLPKTIDILRIWASQEGHVALFAQWWPKQEARPRKIPQEFVLQLEKGTAIGGTVTNDDGDPIAGAKVYVSLVDDNGKPELVSTSPVPDTWLATGGDARTTDERGRWSLDNAPAGDGFGFRVMLNHPGYISDYTWGGLQNEQQVSSKAFRERSATIAMHRGVTLSGVVTDGNGKKVPDAVVIWGDEPYQQEGSQEVRTDANGRYRFPPLPSGRLNVTVVAPGWAPDQQTIPLAPDHATLDFELEPGKSLRLRFVDGQGAVVPGVSVGIQSWRGGRALYNHIHPNVLNTRIPVLSNEDGIYEWTWAPDDEVTYTTYKDGYQDGRSLKLTAGADTEIEIMMHKLGSNRAARAK
jgi:protocatechuate 3,4-dioxygenase beta subunit